MQENQPGNHVFLLQESIDINVFSKISKNKKNLWISIFMVLYLNLFQMRNVSDDTISSLRSVVNQNFLVPRPKLNLFKNSLTYSGAIIWNSIPLEIKNSNSLNIFVNKCKAWMKQGE